MSPQPAQGKMVVVKVWRFRAAAAAYILPKLRKRVKKERDADGRTDRRRQVFLSRLQDKLEWSWFRGLEGFFGRIS